MELPAAIAMLAQFSEHEKVSPLLKSLNGYVSAKDSGLLDDIALDILLDSLRARLRTIANDKEYDEIIEGDLTLADAAYAVLIALATLSPANEIDPNSREPVADIEENILIILSTGHWFDVVMLIGWHNARDYVASRGESSQGKYLCDPYENNLFSEKDRQLILQKAAELGLTVEPEPQTRATAPKQMSCAERAAADSSRNVTDASSTTRLISGAPSSTHFTPAAQPSPRAEPTPDQVREANEPWLGGFCSGDKEHLMKLVAYGQEAAAKALLERYQDNPDTLRELLTTPHEYTFPTFEEADVEWFGNRKVSGTVLEIAMKEYDDDMAKMLRPFVEQLPARDDGQSEFEAQTKRAFPGGIAAHTGRLIDKIFDFGAIIETIDSIEATDSNDEQIINQALETFRQEFKEHVQNEPYFNPYHELKAWETYAEKFNDWNLGQRDAFFVKVIGYTQRYQSACYSQAHAQGIHFIVERNESLRRDFEFQYDLGRRAAPTRRYASGGNGGLGFEWAAFRASCLSAWGGWTNYLKQKQSTWATYAVTNSPTRPDSVRDNVSLS